MARIAAVTARSVAGARTTAGIRIPLSAQPPSYFSGLKAWFKADAITGLNDGDSVASWTDSSGVGNTATQSTGANKPTYKVNMINSLPALSFDGSASRMVFDSIAASLSGFDPQITVFVVGRASNANNPNAFFGMGSTSDGGTVSWENGLNNVGSMLSYTRVDGSGAAQTSQSSTGPGVNTFGIMTYEYFGNKRFTQVSNGTAANVNAFPVGNKTFNVATLGAQHRGGSYSDYLNGYIAEMAIFNRALITDERRSIEVYLSQRYKISGPSVVSRTAV